MEPVHRNIILGKKEYLEEKVDLKHLLRNIRDSNIFTKSMFDDIDIGSMNLFEELTSRGPDAFSKFLDVLRNSGYNNLIQALKPTDLRNCPCQRVQCLLINNPTSPNSKDQCSDVEAEALEGVFCRRWGNSSVTPLDNLCGEDMFEELSSYSKKDFRECELCVVTILSYGKMSPNGRILYGCNDQPIYENDIFKLFSAGSASRVPKLFLLPCCNEESDSLELFSPKGFSDIHVIRWPCSKISSDSFGEILAECFELEFQGKTEINLLDIAKRAYDKYNL